MEDYDNTDNSIYENSFSESESEYNRDLSDCNSFKAIKKRSISDLRAKLEMNNKKRYFELLVCENLWLRSNRDMKAFREKLQKIKKHNLLPELPDEILSYNDKDLKEYIKKYFRIGSPLQNRSEDFQEDQDNSLDDIFDRKDKNNKITNLYKERLDFDILPFKVSFPRYQLDFVELSKIGSGGFANVYKAKHILDERLYAIKKIFFLEKFLPSLNKVVREVKTLAKLNHKRIVRYYNAWIEKIEDIDTSLEENIIVEENSEVCESDIDIESESLRSKEGVIMKYQRTEKVTHQQKNDKRPLKNKYLYVLYIQMEMCDNSLRNWLDERKEINEEKNINLMNQLLVAVNHIHENNIMHRDLKPSNCFIQIRSPKMDTNSSSPISSSCANSNSSSSSLDSSPSTHPFSYSTSPLYQTVIPPVSNPSTPVSPNDQKIEIKIGDFGLSKEILDHNQHLFTSLDGFDILDGSIGDLKLLDINRPNFKMEGEDDQEHTSNLGTEYYIAPELSTQSYNQKSDVFSLGIIFFELYNIFQTKMDRAKKLKNLFNGILPQEMLEKYPLASNFILSMVSSDPKERRSIGELLNDEIFKKKETLDEKNIILIQKKTISNLSLQNEELEKKVLKLKNKLKAYKKLLNNTDNLIPTANDEK